MNIINSNRGFTIIEIVIVIVILGILGAVAVPKLGSLISDSKEESTKAEMKTIKDTIVGEFGYRATVGADPTSADDLVTKPTGVAAWNKFTQRGWNGPYINDDGTENFKRDAWDNPYQFTANEIRSRGPDATLNTADDIVLNF